MAWIVRLVEAGGGGDDRGADLIEIAKPADLRDIANLGLSLAEEKQVLAAVQREVVAAQARDHAVQRPTCRGSCASLVAGSRAVLTGRRIAGRRRNSIGCKLTSRR